MNSILLFLLLPLLVLPGAAQNVFINEIRSNDSGTDDQEFIELIGPAGTDISGWTVSHVNGSGGSVLFSFTFPTATVIPDDGITDINGTGVGFLVLKRSGTTVMNADFDWGDNGLQNGPDGLFLSNSNSVRIQALTWNGSGELGGGVPPWRNIGNDANSDNSLSAPDSVSENLAQPWDYIPPSPGFQNGNQSAGDITLPVQLTGFRAIAGDGRVRLVWTTQSEVDNMGFNILRSEDRQGPYLQIAGYASHPDLRGAGNTSAATRYVYIDKFVLNGTLYWYQLVDVDMDGVPTKHAPVSALPHIAQPGDESEQQSSLPQRFLLNQNYPNPFNPSTTISFDLSSAVDGFMDIDLSVYNLLGEKTTTLFQGPLTAGSHTLVWRGTDSAGRTVPGGVYFYVLTSRKFTSAGKMVYLK